MAKHAKKPKMRTSGGKTVLKKGVNKSKREKEKYPKVNRTKKTQKGHFGTDKERKQQRFYTTLDGLLKQDKNKKAWRKAVKANNLRKKSQAI